MASSRDLVVHIIGDSKSLEKAFRSSTKSGKQFETAMKGVSRSTSGFSRGFLSGAGALTSFGGALALTSGSFFAGAGLIAGLKAVTTAAGDFEQIMDVLQETTDATALQMQRASAAAKQLGADITLPATSATDAAVAMEQLAKGGLSIDEALSAARGTLQLAAAAQTDVATAANTTARALSAFRLSGADAGMVADALAGGAKSATGSIDDFAIALAQAASAAHAGGFSVQETVTAITGLAKAGIVGSDAGTSLRVMFTRLIPSTVRARKVMQQYGLTAIDSRGTFRDLRDILADYTRVLSSVSDAERSRIVNTIFGQDAQRAANEVLGMGVRQYDALFGAVTRSGNAQRAAAAQQKGYKGALDAFNSVLETTKATLGEVLLPALTRWLRAGAAWLGQTQNQKQLQDGFRRALERTSGAIRGVADAAKGIVDVVGGWENALTIAAGAFVGFKIQALTATSAIVASNLLAAGTVSKAWQAALISTGWGALAVAAGIAAVYIITHWEKVKVWFQKFWIYLKAAAFDTFRDMVEPFSHLPGRLGKWARDAKDRINENMAGLREDMAALGKESGEALADAFNQAVAALPGKPKEFGPGPGMTPPNWFDVMAGGGGGGGGAGTRARRRATAEQRNRWFDDLIGRRLDRIQDLPLRQQFKGLENIRKLITERLAVTKDITRKLTLQDALVDIARRKKSVNELIAEEIRSAQQAAQMGALGLGVPSIAALKRRLGRVGEAVQGTVLNTKAMQKRLKTIRKILVGGMGEVSDEVLSTLERMLAEIDRKLKEHADTPLTKGRSFNARRLLQGLGLDPDEMRAIASRLSRMSTAGKFPAMGAGAFGVAVPGIQNTVYVQVDGRLIEAPVTKEQQKRRRANPTQKRGPRSMVR